MAGEDMAGDDKRREIKIWRESTLEEDFHPHHKLPIGIPTFLRRVYVENEFLVSEVTGTIWH